MSLSNILEPNNFEIHAIALNGNGGRLDIAKDTVTTTSLHLGDTSTPVYINEQLYTVPAGFSLTLAPVGSFSNANAMTLVGNTLNLEPANLIHPGVLTTDTQTIAGIKTFNNGVLYTNATIGYTPTNLNYYETFSATYAMTGAASVNFVCTFVRIGNMVTLSWNSVTGVASSGPGLQLSTVPGTVPARFLKENMSAVIPIIDGPLSTVISTGNIFFLTGGAINITAFNNGSFSNPGFCGFLASSITYSV